MNNSSGGSSTNQSTSNSSTPSSPMTPPTILNPHKQTPSTTVAAVAAQLYATAAVNSSSQHTIKQSVSAHNVAGNPSSGFKSMSRWNTNAHMTESTNSNDSDKENAMMNQQQQHVIYRSNANSNSTAANRVKSAASGYSRFNRNSYGDSEVLLTIIYYLLII